MRFSSDSDDRIGPKGVRRGGGSITRILRELNIRNVRFRAARADFINSLSTPGPFANILS